MSLKNVKYFLTSALLTMSFKSWSSDGHHHEHMSEKTMEKTDRKSLSKEDKKSLLKILEANENLHKAFFSYEGKVVEKEASNLKLAVENMKNEDISKLLNFSKSKLDQIKSENDREVNNENYHIFSMALIHVLKNYNAGHYNAFSCPMVKKKWVQNTAKMSEVHNPYASGMPHCGTQDSHY